MASQQVPFNRLFSSSNPQGPKVTHTHTTHPLIPMASEASSDSFQLVFRAPLSSEHCPFLGQGRGKRSRNSCHYPKTEKRDSGRAL